MRLEVRVGTIASLNAITPVLVAAVGQLSQKKSLHLAPPVLLISSQPNEWDVPEKIGNVRLILERFFIARCFRRLSLTEYQGDNAYFQVLKAIVSA